MHVSIHVSCICMCVCVYVYVYPCVHMFISYSILLPWRTLTLQLVLATQWCLTLCNPMDCNPPSSSVHGKNTGVGLPFPFPGDLPDPEIESRSPALQEDSLPSELWGKFHDSYRFLKIYSHWPDKPKLHQFKGNKKPLTWTFPEKLQKTCIPCLLCTSLPRHHLLPLGYGPHFLVLPYRLLPQKGEHQGEEGRLFTASSYNMVNRFFLEQSQEGWLKHIFDYCFHLHGFFLGNTWSSEVGTPFCISTPRSSGLKVPGLFLCILERDHDICSPLQCFHCFLSIPQCTAFSVDSNSAVTFLIALQWFLNSPNTLLSYPLIFSCNVFSFYKFLSFHHRSYVFLHLVMQMIP